MVSFYGGFGEDRRTSLTAQFARPGRGFRSNPAKYIAAKGECQEKHLYAIVKSDLLKACIFSKISNSQMLALFSQKFEISVTFSNREK